jgi:hypothetical protein
MSDPNEYPSYDYPPPPESQPLPSEPAGVHRDDHWYDPTGVYRGEYDRTDIYTPQPDPVTWWER